MEFSQAIFSIINPQNKTIFFFQTEIFLLVFFYLHKRDFENYYKNRSLCIQGGILQREWKWKMSEKYFCFAFKTRSFVFFYRPDLDLDKVLNKKNEK